MVKAFPLRLETRQGCLLLTLQLNKVLEVPARPLGKKKASKLESKVKLLLFAILYEENPKDSRKNCRSNQ